MAILYTPESRRDARNYPRRVYYSCHEDDHGLLDEITQNLRLFMEDCVIAFREPGTATEPTHLDEVEDFPLVVFPVTQSWFCAGIHQQEFARLKAQNKPMIPILFNDTLTERFNTHTGDMQFLRRSDPEYLEKLNRSLQSLLLDQETVEQVHKVFTHKLFIAYCREDLEQVVKLIRCLHQSEEGRLISVWFDKYLQTGRNFEEIIFSQLDDSQLFGMVLTPSLVGRDTYVKRREYPHALAEEKKVIVFQLADADWQTLHAELKKIALEKGIPFPEHPLPVRVSRDDAFAMFVKKLLNEVAGSSAVADKKERDYLLGLAYRNGIGVEFDYRYAMKKFKAAAGAGDHRAAHCLADMFYHGVGVSRDLKQAKKWYIREIEYLFNAYKQTVDTIKQEKLLLERSENGLWLDLSQKMEAAKKIILEMACALVAQACLNARTLRDVGYWDDAKTLYQMAQKALDWSEKNVNRIGVKAKYGPNLENELNQFLLYLGERDLPALKKTWAQALAAWGENDPGSCYTAVKSGYNYAVALMQEGQMKESRQVMERVLGLIENSHQTLPQTIREIQLLLYRDIGKTYLHQNPPVEERKEIAAKARIHLQRMQQLYDAYPFDVAENPDLLFILPQGSMLQAASYFFEGDYLNAFVYYVQALMDVEETQTRLGDLSSQRDLPVSILQMYAQIAEQLHQYPKVPEKIMERYRKILEQFEALTYHEKHQSLAQEYFKKIRAALNTWENNAL